MLSLCLLKGPVQACSSILIEKSKAKPMNGESWENVQEATETKK